MSILLEVRNLKKTFPDPKLLGKNRIEAVRGVSFKIEKGKCVGLLGPNGAGKTTTIEMIEGITEPSSGEILYKGNPIGADFKAESGIQFQSTALPDYLRVGEVIELFSSFYEKKASIKDLRELCSLDELWNRDAHKLSGGQRQRLLLALGLVNDPEIVFLDEPTTGLDPQARRNFWDLVKTIQGKGKTVVLTTHYMEEAYLLCDELLLMDRGVIIAEGSPQSLLKTHFDGVTIELPVADFAPMREKLDHSKVKVDWTAHVKENQIEIPTKDVTTVLKELGTSGVTLERMRIRERTLDDLFLALTGKDLRT